MDVNAHGGDIYTYYEKWGKTPLDFSANVNPLGLPLGVKQAIINELDSFCAYPDIKCRRLIKKLSEFEKVKPEYLLAGNGAADIIFKTVYALKPKKALILAPTFSEYEKALNNVKCEVLYFSLKEENDFCVTDDILEQITDIDIMFLCNPNNPTGMVTSVDIIKKIAAKCKDIGCFLVIDECFNDFLHNRESYTFKPYIEEYKNVIILKAFTKIFAMAGVRLGYCINADTKLLSDINGAGQAWSVSSVAQVAGVAALKEKNYLLQTKENTKNQREYLQNELKKLKIKTYESYANYILITTRKDLYELLYEKGILIRKCENFHGLNECFFRVAVKDETSNKKLIDALYEIKEKNANG